MQRVNNTSIQPVVLDDGTIIPAGARGFDATLSERDYRRHVEAGRLTVIESSESTVAATSTAALTPRTAEVNKRGE